MKKNKVDDKMTLGDAISKFPESAEIMMKHGLHCIGCHVAGWETIRQGALAHGMGSEELDRMIREINESIKNKK